jgi:predicted acetyltransferase
MGYTVFAPERRRGYAAEAVAGLMDWARGQGVTNFVLSIAPANTASRAVATRLGFTGPIDQVIDEVDGPEDIWVLLDRGAGG